MGALDRLGRPGRIAVRVVGFVLLGLVVFAFALQATFPYDRVKDKIVDALSAKYETKIGSIERGIIPGRMTLHDITLRTRPTKPDEEPTIFFVKSLEVHVGLFALLGQTAKIHLDAVIGTGSVTGTIALSKTNTSVHVTGTRIPSKLLPVKEALGLPMTGPVSFAVNLELPAEKQKGASKATPNWQKAVGVIELDCPSNCTIGDGKTKLKTKVQNTRSAAFAADGIEFGTVNVSSLAMRVDIKKGTLALSKLDLKSDDGTLVADFEVALAPALDDSEVSGCLKFAGSDALLKREAKTYTAIAATGGPYGTDKLYHIKLEGKFRDVKKRPVLCGTGEGAGKSMDDFSGTGGEGGGRHGRPNLTLQNDSAGTTVDAGINTTEGMAAGTIPVNPPPPVQIDAGLAEQQGLDAAVVGPQPGPEGEVNVKGYAPTGVPPVEQPPPPPQQPNGMDPPVLNGDSPQVGVPPPAPGSGEPSVDPR